MKTYCISKFSRRVPRHIDPVVLAKFILKEDGTIVVTYDSGDATIQGLFTLGIPVMDNKGEVTHVQPHHGERFVEAIFAKLCTPFFTCNEEQRLEEVKEYYAPAAPPSAPPNAA